ncbi:replication protein, partial [Bacillus velezensis]
MAKRVRRIDRKAAGKDAERKKPSKVTLFCRSRQMLKHVYGNRNIQ